MKLVYPICCGVDIHKKSLVATIVTTDKEGISIYQQRTFSTINSDIERFHCWLIENNCYHVCMESTGKYWIPIFNVLDLIFKLFSLTQNMFLQLRVRKLIKRILNGLLIFLSLIWLELLLYLQKILGLYAKLLVIDLNWSV